MGYRNGIKAFSFFLVSVLTGAFVIPFSCVGVGNGKNKVVLKQEI